MRRSPRVRRSRTMRRFPRVRRSRTMRRFPRVRRCRTMRRFPRVRRSRTMRRFPRARRSRTVRRSPRAQRSRTMRRSPRAQRSRTTRRFPRVQRSRTTRPFRRVRPSLSQTTRRFPRAWPFRRVRLSLSPQQRGAAQRRGVAERSGPQRCTATQRRSVADLPCRDAPDDHEPAGGRRAHQPAPRFLQDARSRLSPGLHRAPHVDHAGTDQVAVSAVAGPERFHRRAGGRRNAFRHERNGVSGRPQYIAAADRRRRQPARPDRRRHGERRRRWRHADPFPCRRHAAGRRRGAGFEAENVGVASPNYVYRTLQDESRRRERRREVPINTS